MRGDHDGLRVRLLCARQGEHIEARGLGLHDEVGDDHIEVPVQELLARGGKRVHDGAHMARLAQCLGHRFRVIVFVVHHEHLCPHARIAHRLSSVRPPRSDFASLPTAVNPQIVPGVWIGGSGMGTGRMTPKPSTRDT